MKNKDLIDEWMRFAQMDYDTAVHLHGHMIPEPLEIICFHCQQSAEKAVKALMLPYEIDIPRTHDIGVLTWQLNNLMTFPQEILDACNALTSYAVGIRYPNAKELTSYHVAKALRDVAKVLGWVKEVLAAMERDEAEPSDA